MSLTDEQILQIASDVVDATDVADCHGTYFEMWTNHQLDFAHAIYKLGRESMKEEVANCFCEDGTYSGDVIAEVLEELKP